jgi:hypothetical protein
MSEVNYIISRAQDLCITPRDADKLLDRHDGTAALLYIYLLRCGGAFSLQEAAQRLALPAARLRDAAETLRALGLLEIRDIPAPAEETPEYTAEEVRARTADSPDFTALVAEVQSMLGRVLSGTELKVLFGIYDYLALPPEVILMLVGHCMARTEKRQGSGRKPGMRTIEREAYAWANLEIRTLDMAEAHLRALQRAEEETGKVKAALGIRDRELSATERKYIESWINMGFDAEALALAYDRTVVKTGRLQWKYMDSIVRSWHGKGLHTPREIAEGDAFGGRSIPAGGQTRLAQMDDLIDQMKNRG